MIFFNSIIWCNAILWNSDIKKKSEVNYNFTNFEKIKNPTLIPELFILIKMNNYSS